MQLTRSRPRRSEILLPVQPRFIVAHARRWRCCSTCCRWTGVALASARLRRAGARSSGASSSRATSASASRWLLGLLMDVGDGDAVRPACARLLACSRSPRSCCTAACCGSRCGSRRCRSRAAAAGRAADRAASCAASPARSFPGWRYFAGEPRRRRAAVAGGRASLLLLPQRMPARRRRDADRVPD